MKGKHIYFLNIRQIVENSNKALEFYNIWCIISKSEIIIAHKLWGIPVV